MHYMNFLFKCNSALIGCKDALVGTVLGHFTNTISCVQLLSYYHINSNNKIVNELMRRK